MSDLSACNLIFTRNIGEGPKYRDKIESHSCQLPSIMFGGKKNHFISDTKSHLFPIQFTLYSNECYCTYKVTNKMLS